MMDGISTADFQTRLASLVGETVGKCVTGDDGLTWDDAERFLALTHELGTPRMELCAHGKLELSVGLYWEVDDGASYLREPTMSGIAEMAVKSARWYEEDDRVDDGSQLECLSDYRDKLRASLRLIEARIAELDPEPPQ